MFMLSIYKKELNSMNFIISGKNIEVTPGLKEAIEQKLGKLERYFTPETEIIVTLSVEKERQKIEVTIPAGIDNGQSVRIREKGEPGTNGGPRGDLLVEVNVSRHPIFQRQDMHIFSTVPISFAQAALGGDVKIQTVDGAVIYNVKPGTKTDTKVRLKGKGVPSLRNSAVRGDHYVTLVIQTPEKLSAEAKEALRRFDELSGNSLHQNDSNPEKSEKKTKRKGFMDKVKEAFEGED